MNDAMYDLIAYTQGPFSRVDDERIDEQLEVIGELPPELHGLFVQNQANPRHEPIGLYHWFDGDGMVHGLWLEGGRASYRNRYVRTADFAEEEVAGRCLWPGILMPFTPGSRPDKDCANTDVIWHAGKLWATNWLSGTPYRIGVPAMDTLGAGDFGGTLPRSMAAHGKVDARTGEMMFLDFDLYREPFLRHGVVSAEGRVTSLVDIAVEEPSLYHDIAITEHFTIIPDYPMFYERDKLKQGRRRVRFDHQRPTRFAVVPRHGDGPVRWFEADPCYSYHTVNAWEELTPRGTVLRLIGCRIELPVPRVGRDAEPDIPRLFHLRLHPFLYEWTLYLGTGEVKGRQLDDVPTEFPRMDDRQLGRRGRYAYHPRIKPGPTLVFDGFIKYDLQRGTSEACSWGPGRIGTETVFAPRHGGVDEDDGWVVTFTSREDGEDSELVVVDARDVGGGPMARVRLRRRVPIGFHAGWVPGAEVV